MIYFVNQMEKEIKKSPSVMAGKEHPLSILANRAYDIFSSLGFEIAVGPELESEWYNFDVLNVSKDHPARDMQDTFFIKDQKEKVLRTHTTNVSARAIEKASKEGRIPCAFISIGKVFRNEATDSTHETQFFQIDGTMIGEDIKFKDQWLEVMGAGMLHPNVLKNVGLDPKKIRGFAFGGGLDRIAMVKWNISDVRLFYQGDLRLNQF
ncbi:MAG: Phenylalanyl-tRNA synthetase [Candidatus Nomurabacteria bacterium GW2011_GWA2_35_80]|uniref:phenylalanine--tRNA ligase n=1 Tax=Candidatus Nomurabacteria bacterium GW2011_GWA2_35_80 TaxID=1618733 RepID=A0A0G0FLL8_9BACT|nr:MAG: Phenylalanyl-tRNA synthetase [Candidatus Nomurabacteria bacterium GW2011_GWA2_35_80]